MLALTGFRLMEAQGLELSWVDAERGSIHFPDTKSGAQVRAIGSAVVSLLEAQPETPGSPYFFTACDRRGHYKQVPDLIVRLCSAAHIEGVTAHTLRYTFGSIAGDLGFSKVTIATPLGHGKRGVTQGYVHIDEGSRHAVEAVSARIADLLDSRAKSVRPAMVANRPTVCARRSSPQG